MSTVEELAAVIDIGFTLTMAAMIFANQVGFALLEVGLVRRVNAKTILMKNFLDTCITGIAYWSIGHSLAYGTDAGVESFSGGYEGHGFFLWKGSRAGGDVSWFLAFAFAATTVSIVSGAVAERCHMMAYCIAAFVLAAIVHPIAVYWVWSDAGWLSMSNADSPGGTTGQIGMLDFAGSCVVHLCGGTAALVGAVLVGPRLGRFVEAEGVAAIKLRRGGSSGSLSPAESESGVELSSVTVGNSEATSMTSHEDKPVFRDFAVEGEEAEHKRPRAYTVLTKLIGESRYVVLPMSNSSATMQAAGVFFLWFGWYGFNMASVGSVTADGATATVALCAVNTTLAACSASIASVFISYFLTDDGISLESTINGTLAGLVAISAGCATITHGSAVFVGFMAAFFFVVTSKLMLKYGVDDVVDAVAIHGSCGAWGVISTALLSTGEFVKRVYGVEGSVAKGLFYGGDGKLLLMALTGIVSVGGFTAVAMYTIFAIINYFGHLRVSGPKERDGLDLTNHGNFDRVAHSLSARRSGLMGSAILLEKLQRLQNESGSIDKVHLLAIGIDCGADLSYLLSRFEALAGGSLTLSGRGVHTFVSCIHSDIMGVPITHTPGDSGIM